MIFKKISNNTSSFNICKGSCEFGDQSIFDQCLMTRIKCQKSWILKRLWFRTWLVQFSLLKSIKFWSERCSHTCQIWTGRQSYITICEYKVLFYRLLFFECVRSHVRVLQKNSFQEKFNSL